METKDNILYFAKIKDKAIIPSKSDEKLVPTSEVEKYINLNYSLGRSKK